MLDFASDSRPVTSLADYVSRASAICEGWKKKRKRDSDWVPWFRGEPDAELATALQPKLYREKDKLKEFLYEEQELRLEFWRRGVQLIAEDHPIDKWERYFLMQHYGVPTRLLDWSDGALVALYFALSGIQRNARGGDPVVYALDPWLLNDQTFKQWPTRKKDRPSGVAVPHWEEAVEYLPDEFDNRRLGPELPLAVDPTHVSHRVAAQRSRFVVFGRDTMGLKTVSENASKAGSALDCLRIKRTAIRGIRRELTTAGVSESSIFPDLEGLGRELKHWWDERHSKKTR